MPTPEFVDAGFVAHLGESVYGLDYRQMRFLKIDLLTGERTWSARYQFLTSFVPGVKLAAEILDEGRRRQLLILDPQDLTPIEAIPIGGEPTLLSMARGVAIYVRLETRRFTGEMPIFLVDQESGRRRATVQVALYDEVVISASADREGLVVVLADRGPPSTAVPESGPTRLRVVSYPFDPERREWSVTSEGCVAGNPRIEGGLVRVSTYQGDFITGPVCRDLVPEEKKALRRAASKPKMISLDRETGAERDPGVVTSDRGGGVDIDNLGVWLYGHWTYAPGKIEDVFIQNGEKDYTVVRSPMRAKPFRIVWHDQVFEAIGGGVIVIKDFAQGAGVLPLSTTLRGDRR